MTMKRIFVVCLTLTICSAALAAEGYERYLIPISAAQPGAYGTFWLTQAWAVHEGPEGIAIVGAEVIDLPINIYRDSIPLELAVLPTEQEPPGAILYVSREVADQVHILPRLLRLEGGVVADEMPLPVVNEKDFATRTRYFGVLRKTSSERIHLRVYSLDLTHSSPEVRVRVQAAIPGVPGGWMFRYDEVLPLSARQKFVVFDSRVFERRPLALEVPLDPILESIPEGALVAISVLAASDDLRIWAILSETNNTTQRVRVSVPH
jgi:hypothetical protein